ncbi:MAG: hypothetical protein K8S98_09230 [Planctomycetes bacterium]|nr:hypothetical protein [Planctomycetota bacterium]
MKLESLALFALLAVVPPASSVDGTRAACCSIPVADGTAKDAKAPSLASIKELVGTWYAVENGKTTDRVVAEYRVTAGGSAVIETLFPKTEMEMISVYFTEGDALWLAHFCMLGNHPRMKAELDARSGEVVWRCQGGENFTDCTAVDHMHEGRVKRIDADHLVSSWAPMLKGKSTAAEKFELVRKR